MTVGEMVRVQGERVLAELKRECPEALDGPASSLTGLWLQGLRELGLWDAEVLEFELRRDHEDSDMLWWECDQKHSAAGSSVFSETFDGPEAEYVGQRVRVIVLPVEEK